MYQLIATDLDGTLLSPDHTVPPHTAQTLRDLQARGLRFAIATGRHYCDVRGIRDVLGIEAYLITSNGARVHDPHNRQIHAENIDPALVRALVQPKFAAGTSLNLYLDETWLIGEPNEDLLRYHQDSGFTYEVADIPSIDGEGVAKILYVSAHAHLLALEARLLAEFDDTLYVTFSALDCLEVMAPTVSKGHALTVVMDELGIAAADCIAFGDNLNDLEMLQTAGHPFLMGNANPRLVAQLPGVPQIGSNTEGGVALHLRTLFGL
ncbi:Cof-type HAD-IIB family hydrolase [Chitiniphilus purpureus]|uniref:Cof-type HAD-IIB family hydrolase n=1 Tax=Chitiniphilus purpureus TaxID=2981137 RepID=A0ABY6DRE2_9NEIS|nr:Cof-type HAD-IIB family hydrolase [Chitiniphilus sp. CD1]UXY16897.1 Cof-type HAD-IIB family hydrolase [Chitiniphilus sp. CD1]